MCILNVVYCTLQIIIVKLSVHSIHETSRTMSSATIHDVNQQQLIMMCLIGRLYVQERMSAVMCT